MSIYSSILLLSLALLLPCSSFGDTGTASWYGDELKGHSMANGKPFDPSALTCASWYYPLGEKLLVSSSGNSVIVTVTDRGPNKRLGRIIDLSSGSFKRLANLKVGLINVSVTKYKP